MSFYTSVERYGNKLLYRGYTQAGKRIQKKIWFKPTLFTKSHNAETDWKSLIGNKPLRPIHFESMSEATAYTKSMGEVENHEIHGMWNFIFQYIRERFPHAPSYNSNHINVNTIDIEVASDDGFPDPDRAEKEVISIACYSTFDKVWRIWGLGDYDVSKSYIFEKFPDANVQYIKCKDEIDLLNSFLTQWSKEEYCPDVITGWYVRVFDIPYLVNRIRRVMGEDAANRLSPWKKIDQKSVSIFKKVTTLYEIKGIRILDYLDLFKKFGHAYGSNHESYKLDYIAHVVLGEKKLSYQEYGNLHTLYKENHQLFIDYNLRDIELVVRMDQEAMLLDLVYQMAYKAGVNYSDTLGTTAIWDAFIHRELYAKRIAVPPTKEIFNPGYPGAYVKEPKPGMYDWVVSFDLNSLYPNLIVQYNISPETLRREPGHPNSVEHWMNKKGKVNSKFSVAANGSVYNKDKMGILPEIIVKLYDERREMKNKMLKYKDAYEQSKNPQDEIEANKYDNAQTSIKLFLNSLYGALGNKWFRYFNLSMAEGITLSGQLSILWSEKVMNDKMNQVMGTEGVDYVIAIDTDSLYVNFGPLVEKFNPKDPVKFLDKVSEEKFVPWLAEGYSELSEKQNCRVNRMKMAREVIADRGIWTAKKRYILNVHNSEGVQYAKPKLKIMGIEAIKSSTPEVCRDKFKEVFNLIMTSTAEETFDYIENFKNEFKSLEPHQVAFPRSVSEIKKWIEGNTYKKGTPINTRAAFLYNKALAEHSLDKKYDKIQEGSKMKYTYLRKPNPLHENVIGFEDFLPKELMLDKYVDYDLQFEKTS
jgi:DNA polymerase elongation subunit (family B)